MINWARVYDVQYASTLEVYQYWPSYIGYCVSIKLDNFAKCLGAAAAEYTRVQHIRWVLFGWAQ